MNITKEIIEQHFPPQFIKIAEKEEYLQDFLDGHLYMKASGYFRKLEDGYRGDIHDGRNPIPTKNIHIVAENPKTGERIFFDEEHGMTPGSLAAGFNGDDRIPIFCMGYLNAEIMEVTGENFFEIKSEIVDELSKFGQFFVMVPMREMMAKVRAYNENNSDTAFLTSTVEYFDPEKEMFDRDKSDSFGQYRSFFRKVVSYKNQHEWRAILIGAGPQIKPGEDYITVEIGKFNDHEIMPIEILKNCRFSMEAVTQE